MSKARTDFATFINIFRPPGGTFVFSKLHQLIASVVQDMADGKVSTRRCLSQCPQSGKQLSDSTPVLTTSGWKTHGELRVGDFVYHPSGKATQVVALSEKTLADYEVTLSNHEKFKCHGNHIWSLYWSHEKFLSNFDTKTLAESELWRGTQGKRGSEALFHLPYVSPLEGKEVELPVDPYTLGAWLGNGQNDNPTLGGVDHEVFEAIPYPISSEWYQEHSTGSRVRYSHFDGLRPGLKAAGVFKNKHVPDIYFTASVEQRLQLIAGLMDTDGCLSGKTGQYAFSNCNKQIIDSIVSLIYSFGWKCSVTSQEPKLSTSGIQGRQVVYVVGFTPNQAIPCRVPRKQSNFFPLRRRLSIVKIERCAPEIGNCIQVASPDGLYLVGRTLQPTHNSEISAKLAAAWLLGSFPGLNVAYTSHSHELCVEVSDAVRDIIEHPFYSIIFPDAKPKQGSKRKDFWKLTNGSSLKSRPAGSKFTGRRIDWAIVDDPHKGRQEAESKVQREGVVKWFFADIVTRMSPGGVIFVIHTLWHPEDLIGVISSPERNLQLAEADAEDEIFTCTTIPAICEKEEGDPLGRKVGESCFPEVRDERFFHNIRQSIPSYEWESQYQQRPRLAGAGNIDFSKINYINWNEVPSHLQLLRHYDLAVSESQAADYTAGGLVAYDEVEDKFYICGIMRAQANWIKMRKRIIDISEFELENYGVSTIGVEAVAGFIAAYQDLKQILKGRVEVKATKPIKSKLARATPWINKIEAGRLYMVRGAWNKEFLSELDMFGGEGCVHDDMVDCVSGGFSLLTGRNRYKTDKPKAEAKKDYDQKLISKLGAVNIRPSSVNRPTSVNRPGSVQI